MKKAFSEAAMVVTKKELTELVEAHYKLMYPVRLEEEKTEFQSEEAWNESRDYQVSVMKEDMAQLMAKTKECKSKIARGKRIISVIKKSGVENTGFGKTMRSSVKQSRCIPTDLPVASPSEGVLIIGASMKSMRILS